MQVPRKTFFLREFFPCKIPCPGNWVELSWQFSQARFSPRARASFTAPPGPLAGQSARLSILGLPGTVLASVVRRCIAIYCSFMILLVFTHEIEEFGRGSRNWNHEIPQGYGLLGLEKSGFFSAILCPR